MRFMPWIHGTSTLRSWQLQEQHQQQQQQQPQYSVRNRASNALPSSARDNRSIDQSFPMSIVGIQTKDRFVRSPRYPAQRLPPLAIDQQQRHEQEQRSTNRSAVDQPLCGRPTARRSTYRSAVDLLHHAMQQLPTDSSCSDMLWNMTMLQPFHSAA